MNTLSSVSNKSGALQRGQLEERREQWRNEQKIDYSLEQPEADDLS